jgi:DNA-directed RNA polymerase subunit alpha
MDKSVKLNAEITIEKGRGFVPAEENKATAPMGQYLQILFIHQLRM